MGKKNCWESKQCGREPGGSHVKELGVCPAATDLRFNNVHDGHNGGRACWVATGTLCGGKVQVSFTKKMLNCLDCAFINLVRKEEGGEYVPAVKLFTKFTPL